jgi:membrane protease YdiL (CAAX protease family)
MLLRSKEAIQIDMFWLLWFLVAFSIFLYLPVYYDIEPSLAFKSMIGFSFLIGGTVGSAILCGFKTDRFFSLDELVKSLGFITVGIASIYIVNLYSSTLQLSSVPISQTLFQMLMGVSEEAVFRGFICTAFTKMSHSSLVGVVVSSLFGTAYHAAVYGSINMNMLIVFGSFCVLGMTYVLSGYRLSVPMTAHVLVNYISSLG